MFEGDTDLKRTKSYLYERVKEGGEKLSFGPVLAWYCFLCTQLLLKKRVATAATSAGPRKGQSLKALLGFHSSKADGMLYGMSPSEGCFFRWKMVREGCSTSASSHSCCGFPAVIDSRYWS